MLGWRPPPHVMGAYNISGNSTAGPPPTLGAVREQESAREVCTGRIIVFPNHQCVSWTVHL